MELEGYDTAQKTYTFSNVQDDHSIIVTFSADKDGDGIPDKEVDEIELKEFIGHTPLEVLGGVLLGILVGVTVPM